MTFRILIEWTTESNVNSLRKPNEKFRAISGSEKYTLFVRLMLGQLFNVWSEFVLNERAKADGERPELLRDERRDGRMKIARAAHALVYTNVKSGCQWEIIGRF